MFIIKPIIEIYPAHNTFFGSIRTFSPSFIIFMKRLIENNIARRNPEFSNVNNTEDICGDYEKVLKEANLAPAHLPISYLADKIQVVIATLALNEPELFTRDWSVICENGFISIDFTIYPKYVAPKVKPLPKDILPLGCPANTVGMTDDDHLTVTDAKYVYVLEWEYEAGIAFTLNGIDYDNILNGFYVLSPSGKLIPTEMGSIPPSKSDITPPDAKATSWYTSPAPIHPTKLTPELRNRLGINGVPYHLIASSGDFSDTLISNFKVEGIGKAQGKDGGIIMEYDVTLNGVPFYLKENGDFQLVDRVEIINGHHR